jgi:hypothetical protein
LKHLVSFSVLIFLLKLGRYLPCITRKKITIFTLDKALGHKLDWNWVLCAQLHLPGLCSGKAHGIWSFTLP